MPRQLKSCPRTSAVSHPEAGVTVPVTDSSVLPPTSCAVISKVPARRLRVRAQRFRRRLDRWHRYRDWRLLDRRRIVRIGFGRRLTRWLRRIGGHFAGSSSPPHHPEPPPRTCSSQRRSRRGWRASSGRSAPQSQPNLQAGQRDRGLVAPPDVNLLAHHDPPKIADRGQATRAEMRCFLRSIGMTTADPPGRRRCALEPARALFRCHNARRQRGESKAN